MTKNLWNNFYSSISQSRRQALLSLACIVAIALHFFLKFFLDEKVSNFPLFAIIAVGGLPQLFQIVIRALNKNLGADLLAFIAFIVAVFLGEYLTATLIVLMLASGQALEEYATRKASFVLEALAKRMPTTVHLRCEKNVEDVAAEKIKIGDLLEIYPHETCPVDGVIIEGSGAMDESYLTGEPYQISKTIGSNVLSGSINGESVLTIRAEKLPQDSRYAEIVEVMKDAQQQRPKLRRLGDQIGAIFAPIALTFALATLFFSGSLTKFLAVLVVATPCPLLIAIPITIISAISIAARHGIIIKDPTVLERLPTCSTAIFDKTGTLTCGQPELTKIILLGDFSRTKTLQMAASLERYSRHPLAAAILNAAQKEKIELLESENVAEKAGHGLIGKVLNHEISVTSRKEIIGLPPLEHGLECVILIDPKPAALFHFRDTPRTESHSFINHLAPNHNFKKIILLSGDRDSEVNYLASLLEIKNVYSGQTPEEKVAIVHHEAKQASTLFMGDGINDAPALMAATVGIAFGQNSAVTSQAAGAVIMESSLAKVDELIHISESMRKIALQSAIGGMFFSLIGMGFAAAGLISPVFGALLQEVIDVVAILNALRLTFARSVAADIRR
jgi:heavy metal translocating P-type ATPase